MKSEKPLILVTNDDSISSKGISALIGAVKDLGEVVVVAPNSAQSGMGHAITINHPLRLEKHNKFGNILAFACSGTPVDCVKIAVSEVLSRKPSVLLSGINHGANTSTNVLYSGTMSAAIEGAMEGIPSIGFSLCSFDPNADFSVASAIVSDLTKKALDKGMPDKVCLNVNIPDVSSKQFQGIKVCRQAHAHWEDRFEKREDQFRRPYYWLTGEFLRVDESEDSDVYWIEKGYASVVPTQFDLTAYRALDAINQWEL